MDFTDKEKRIIERIIREEENENVQSKLKSFRVKRGNPEIPLWKELMQGVALVILIVVFLLCSSYDVFDPLLDQFAEEWLFLLLLTWLITSRVKDIQIKKRDRIIKKYRGYCKEEGEGEFS